MLSCFFKHLQYISAIKEMIIIETTDENAEGSHTCTAEILAENIFYDNKNCILYGLRINVSGKTIREYHYITEDFEKILDLKKLFSDFNIESVHADDIVSDFIAESHFPK